VPADTPIVIDGFATVKAVRHANRPPQKPRTQSGARRPPGPRPKSAAPEEAIRAAHIGHTAVPLRFEIVCYRCGYAFVLHGRLYKPLCPRCREFLNAEDLKIEGEWRTDVQTIGTIEIAAGGVVRGAELQATDIVLAGDAREGKLRAFRRLELCAGAAFSRDRLETRDLCVQAGGAFTFQSSLLCRNVDVEGRLTGSVSASGRVRIRAGGLLTGAVRTPHLVVEEGGGLKAEVFAGAA
jgi:cytoskeletal protein CcmA (bactofilin family)